jgi:class 3 adenylate cyclase/tetratricopeptide (TPR) repeat protein
MTMPPAAPPPVEDTDDISVVSVGSASPYIPRPVLARLADDPKTPDIWFEEIEGSMVLSDVSGFTALSEKLEHRGREGAEILTSVINGYYGRLLEIAESHGGFNLKFGGDALVLFFDGDEHALRAVRAALAMRDATQSFSMPGRQSHGIRIAMSTGVHSGRFQVASLGSADAYLQFFALGKESSRLTEVEGAAGANEVHVSRATRRLIGEQAEVADSDGALLVLSAAEPTVIEPPKSIALESADVTERLLPYLPPPIAQVLTGERSTEVIEPEHRRVSVAFVHILGVDDLVAQSGPKVAFRELQRTISALARASAKYGGFLAESDISANGVKLMALFGAPIAREHDAANALRLALDVEKELAGCALLPQIGVHGGLVFSGDIGSDLRRCYTVMGDSVNMAARLSYLADPGQVVVSQSAAEDAGPEFETEDKRLVSVKGKQEQIPIATLLRERGRVRTESSAKKPIVGRDDELARIGTAIAEAESGKLRLIAVGGEAGIGKTRLVEEADHHLKGRGWNVEWGRCYPYQAANPFDPWSQILRSLLGIEAELDRDEKGAAVVDRLGDLALELADYGSLLNPLVGTKLPVSRAAEALDRRGRRDRLLELLIAVLGGASQERPTAYIIDNFQWADGSSRELLELSVRQLEGLPVLLVVTQRSEDSDDVEAPEEVLTSINLAGLDAGESEQLMRFLLDVPEIPTPVLRSLETLEGGNPLFLEEVARSLRDQIDDPVAAGMLASAVGERELSTRVRSLVMSRIDGLQEASRRLLRMAAVIGYSFRLDTLRRVAGGNGDSIAVSLENLLDQDLVASEDEAGDRLRFSNAVIRDVAYETLTFSQRRTVHAEVAGYLEPFGAEENFAPLAHHFRMAENPEKTLFYSAKAGDQALAVFANSEALQFFSGGLEALERMRGRVGGIRSLLRERVGDCLDGGGRYGEASTQYQSALRGWRVAGEPRVDLKEIALELRQGIPQRSKAADLCHKIARSKEKSTDFEGALHWLNAAEKALPAKAPVLRARIAVSRSVALLRLGRYDDAVKWGREGLTRSRRARDERQLAYALDMLAIPYSILGNLQKAVELRQEAVRLYEELGDLRGLMAAHNNLGSSFQLMGDFDAALENYEDALSEADEIGNFIESAVVHNNIGEVLLNQGQPDVAVEHLEKTVTAIERWGGPTDAAGLAYLNLSRAMVQLDDTEAARKYLDKGLELLTESRASGLLLEARLREAELAFAAGSHPEALAVGRAVLEEAEGSQNSLVQAAVLLLMGRVEEASGRLSPAEIRLQGSIAAARQSSAHDIVARAELALARTRLRLGDAAASRDETEVLLQHAAEAFERLGDEQRLGQAVSLLRELRKL